MAPENLPVFIEKYLGRNQPNIVAVRQMPVFAYLKNQKVHPVTHLILQLGKDWLHHLAGDATARPQIKHRWFTALQRLI